MKKRIIATLLIGICCFALAGCNHTKTTQSEEIENEVVSDGEKENLVDSEQEDPEPTNPWSKYSGIYAGEILIKGAEGTNTVVKIDISDYDVTGKSSVGEVYISAASLLTSKLYYNGPNKVQASGSYIDIFYDEIDNSTTGTDDKWYYGFKDDKGTVLDIYYFSDDGSEILFAKLKKSKDGEKEINRIWNEDGSQKEPKKIDFEDVISTDFVDFSIERYDMNLSNLQRTNLNIDADNGMKIIAVYGTITNKYNQELFIQSIYGGMQNKFIVDENEYMGSADTDTDSGFMGSIQAGQTTAFTLYVQVPENISAYCETCDVIIGFNELFYSNNSMFSPTECKYQYTISLLK